MACAAWLAGLAAGEDYAVADVDHRAVLALGLVFAGPGAYRAALAMLDPVEHCYDVATTAAVAIAVLALLAPLASASAAHVAVR